MSRAETLGIVLTVISLTVALVTWLYPRDQAAPADPASQSTTAVAEGVSAPGNPPNTPTTATVTPSPEAGGTRLDTLAPVTGRANLVELPRALRGQPGYEHAITIACPTNQSTDRKRSVTYSLLRRYVDLSATVRPYYTAQPDAVTYVTAVSGVKQADDTFTRTVSGRQTTASTGVPQPLQATVDGADELTIEVECESPQGMVVLTDARLTPAR